MLVAEKVSPRHVKPAAGDHIGELSNVHISPVEEPRPGARRDAWQLEHTLGEYIISDKPMTEEQWARERADVIDAEPQALDKPKA